METLHAVNPTNPKMALCNAGKIATDKSNVAPDLDAVTCKRCLKLLDKGTEAPEASKPAGRNGEPVPPVATPEMAEEPVVDAVDPYKGLKEVAAAKIAAIDGIKGSGAFKDKAKAASATAKAPKPAKAPTVHLHDADRSSYGTWCKIPGQHTTNPGEVTCKVCRAHIDGKAPLNAVPDRVKAARKAFRSFVARVAYMVFMDAGCTISGSWSVKHTNMAGTTYEVSWSEVHGGMAFVDGEVVVTNLGQDIKQWMEDNWSCGEEK